MKLHDPTPKINIELERLKTLPDSDRNLILEFKNFLEAQGLSGLRVYKYLYTLRRFHNMLGKHFQDADRKDLERVIAEIEKSNMAAWTKQSYKVIVKRFYKWLYGEEQYPPEVSWIKPRIGKHQEKDPDQLITRSELYKLIEAAGNIRNKALIIFLYESGARIGEVAGVRIKDLVFKSTHTLVKLQGKTGVRVIPLVESVPYLLDWLKDHPQRDNPEAPLWVNLGPTNYHGEISYRNYDKIIKQAARKAKIKKRIHLHLFRSSRATELATKLTEYQLCLYFGWTVGSRVVREYVRRSGRDLNNTILNLYGIEEKQAEEKIEEIHKCPRCGSINRREALYCYQCSSALDVQTALQAEQTVQKASKIITTLYKILEKIYEQDKEKFKPLLPDLQALLQFSEQNSEQNQQHPPTAPHESTQPDA